MFTYPLPHCLPFMTKRKLSFQNLGYTVLLCLITFKGHNETLCKDMKGVVTFELGTQWEICLLIRQMWQFNLSALWAEWMQGHDEAWIWRWGLKPDHTPHSLLNTGVSVPSSERDHQGMKKGKFVSNPLVCPSNLKLVLYVETELTKPSNMCRFFYIKQILEWCWWK